MLGSKAKILMKQVVLNIPDKNYPFFMELVKSLDFVVVPEEVKLTKNQQEFVEGTKNSLEQVEQHLNGRIRLKTADQLYDEL
jgi:hypothetical protein